MRSERLRAAIVTAAVLGIGLVVLQRWVAENKLAAIGLVSVWFALVFLLALIFLRGRRGLRLPVLGTFAAIAIASAAIGYWTGFRDKKVDEDIIVATAEASERQKATALSGGETRGEREPRGPVELAMGDFEGADGHAGTGVATVVRQADGARKLTFSRFDVDPGVQVEVYLTRGESDVDDRVELGSLKGNVGDQQYEIPADADLTAYDTVILYCTPFTVRIAVAPLA